MAPLIASRAAVCVWVFLNFTESLLVTDRGCGLCTIAGAWWVPMPAANPAADRERITAPWALAGRFD